MSMRFPVIVLSCLLVSLWVATSAPAADPAKKPMDFRGLAWGAAPSTLPGLKAVEHDGDIVHYERPEEKRDLGGVNLRRLTYSFYKDRFYHAEIDYTGKGAARALQESLEAKYGPPDTVREKTDTDGQPYAVAVWNWPGAVFIGNRYDKNGDRGRVFYFYAPLTEASAKGQGIAPSQAKTSGAANPATSYKVKKGDSLSRIAKRLGTTEQALIAANPGLTEKTLRAGATIALPAGQTAATPLSEKAPQPVAPEAPRPVKTRSAATTTYTLKDGDILSRVANKHGLTTKELQDANPGLDPKKLRPGMEIKLPAK